MDSRARTRDSARTGEHGVWRQRAGTVRWLWPRPTVGVSLHDGREHSRSTVVGWSAGAPWDGDTIQIRIDHFDDMGRVIDREFIDVTRDQIHED